MDPAFVQKHLTALLDWAIFFAPKLLMAIAILIIGFWLAKKFHKLATLGFEKADVPPEVSGFLSSILNILVKAIILMAAASMVGIEVSALLGVLAAAGFAVGLALQGFLGNFASGLTIIFFKPYKVGDWVQISDHFGKVQSVQIFNTFLVTPGDKTLIIPNGQVTDNIITNFSTAGKIRLELSVTMPYAESFPKVKAAIQTALDRSKFILRDPVPQIGIESYDSHNVVITVRPFIHPDDYWTATFEVNEQIKKAFSEKNIKVSYSEGIELGDIGV